MKNEEPKSVQAVFDAEQFRATGHQLIDLLANHLETMQNDRSAKVIPYQNPEQEFAFWQEHFQSDASIVDTFASILKHSIKVHHPKYIGHQVTVPSPIASLAGLLSDLLSNGTGIYEMGMASNAIERLISEIMLRQVGYSEGGSGILTSGGTLANLTALLAARKANAPSDVWTTGHQERLAIMVSEEAHYCIDRAARVMGLGEAGIIKIPSDDRFKMRTELLPQYLQQAQKDGLHVFAVIGCASSTSTGSYDDLETIADFCAQHKLWYHVDGAHGGGVVFSNKYAALAKGIQRADSIVIDFHKMLLTPTLTTSLLFKNGQHAYQNFTQKAEYLFEVQQSKEWYNSGKRTFECTKLMMATKVYTVLKAHGTSIWEQNIDYLYDLARTFADMIRQRPRFELALAPEANIVNFRYLPSDKQDINLFNAKIRKTLIESGQFYIVQTVINETRYLRTTIMNPLTRVEDLEELLGEIERVALEASANF